MGYKYVLCAVIILIFIIRLYTVNQHSKTFTASDWVIASGEGLPSALPATREKLLSTIPDTGKELPTAMPVTEMEL